MSASQKNKNTPPQQTTNNNQPNNEADLDIVLKVIKQVIIKT